MADDAVRSLLCIVERESVVFDVEPKGNMNVMKLKKLIKEGINYAILARDLVLWKARMSMTGDNATNSPTG